MTRTDALKGIYFARVAALIIFGIGTAVMIRSGALMPALTLGVLFAAVLLSGRVQAYFWSELLAGLHLLDRRDYARSKVHSERFLVQLRERPWLRRLIWLGTSGYSLNPEVMALNNLGAAEMQLGEFDAARAHFNRAIALDPLCPLPCRNMGALVLRTASPEEARPWFEKAVALGLRGDWSDRVVTTSQRRNAELSTTGAVIDAPPPTEPPVTGDYIVHLLNDENTPFEFAVAALERVFGLTRGQAVRTAQSADRLGRAACAGFDDQQAAQGKAEELSAFARTHGHSLTCVMEPPSEP